MGGEEFSVDTGYPGYVFVGWAEGQFKTDDGRMMPYATITVVKIWAYGVRCPVKAAGTSRI